MNTCALDIKTLFPFFCPLRTHYPLAENTHFSLKDSVSGPSVHQPRISNNLSSHGKIRPLLKQEGKGSGSRMLTSKMVSALLSEQTEKAFPKEESGQSLSTSTLTLWAADISSVGWPVQRRMVSIPGFYSLDASSAPTHYASQTRLRTLLNTPSEAQTMLY